MPTYFSYRKPVSHLNYNLPFSERTLNVRSLIIMENLLSKRAAYGSGGLRKLFWSLVLAIVLTLGAIPYSLSNACVKNALRYSPEFEKAVAVIKKYEGLHINKKSLVGYGHKVIAGDKYKAGTNLNAKQADALLREDLAKLCAKYRSFGKDSLLLAAFAYNCGIGTVAKSSVYKNLKAGNRDIKKAYLSYAKYRGKTLSQLKRRREEEYNTLFIP